MPELTLPLYHALNEYRHIYSWHKLGERAGEFSKEDEKRVERIYNMWRESNEIIIDCDECLEEAFERLMNACLEYERNQAV